MLSDASLWASCLHFVTVVFPRIHGKYTQSVELWNFQQAFQMGLETLTLTMSIRTSTVGSVPYCVS